MNGSQETLKAFARRELPRLIREDAEFRAFVLELLRQEDPDGAEARERYWAQFDAAASAQAGQPAGSAEPQGGALRPDPHDG